MNHNSFPGEANAKKAPDNWWMKGEDIAEEVPYDKNMAELRKIWARHNTRELTKPSLKNRELSKNVIYEDNSEVVESITRKIQEERILNKDDIENLLQDRFHIAKMDQVGNFLDATNMNGGEDFDVLLPGVLFNEDGSVEETPLSISFKNKDGDYTVIHFSKTKDGGIKGISYSGDEKAGTNVGYQGNGNLSAQTRNRIALDNGEIFKH